MPNLQRQPYNSDKKCGRYIRVFLILTVFIPVNFSIAFYKQKPLKSLSKRNRAYENKSLEEKHWYIIHTLIL